MVNFPLAIARVKLYLHLLNILVLNFAVSLVFLNLYLYGGMTLSDVDIIVLIVCIN